MKDYFIHPQALCESKSVGSRTRIWAFAHIMKDVSIGEDCNICDGVFIESGVVIGNKVTIKSGVQLWEGFTIEDEVFIGPNATFTNNSFPRSRDPNRIHLKTLVLKGASIGANATILPGLVLGRYCMIGAGAVVTKNVPDGAVVIGNPAKILRFVDDVK